MEGDQPVKVRESALLLSCGRIIIPANIYRVLTICQVVCKQWIKSFNPNKPGRWVLLFLSPFYRKGY